MDGYATCHVDTSSLATELFLSPPQLCTSHFSPMETIPIVFASSSKIPYCSQFYSVRTVNSYSRSALPLLSSSSSSAFVNNYKLRLNSNSLIATRKSSLNKVTKCAGSIIRETNESEFADVVLKSERPVLVEFVATWCGPCRLIASSIQSVAQVP